MLRIRLAWGGSKKNRFYYVVVADSRNSRDGRFIERIGFFNPMKSNTLEGLTLHIDRVRYWMNNGARPSKRVSALIKKIN